MRLTLREVLELPAVARGKPLIRSGSDRLGEEVRWVHVSELADVAGTLSGGEIVLSVGVVLTEPGTDLAGYVESLRRSGAVALFVELGRKVERLPEPLVQAARTHRFPVVELQRPVRFVEITEVVHARVLHSQYERLTVSHRAHRVLGPLGIEGAPAEEILDRCAELLARPVVLEDLAHRVLGFAGNLPVEDVLRDWSARSRQVPDADGSSRGGPERWVSTRVGPRRRRWGRLVVPTRVDPADLDDVQLVLERAAEAVTVAHLMTETAEGPDGMATSRLLQDIARGRAADVAVIRARAAALGFATNGPIAVLVARGFGRDGDPDGELVNGVSAAVRALRRPCLVGRVRPQLVGVLLDHRAGTVVDMVDRLVQQMGTDLVAVLAQGPVATSWADLPTALAEAEHVAVLAPGAEPGAPPSVVGNRDLGIRSLLRQIRDDPRLHAFIESRLGPVLALPEDRRRDAVRLLAAYLEAGAVMAEFARRIHLSRAAAYARLRGMEAVLGLDLADAEQRTGLHVALIAYLQEDLR